MCRSDLRGFAMAMTSAASIAQSANGHSRANRTRMWWSEASGSVADLGVLVPIAVALIVSNGLSPTAVLLPAGLLYLVVAWVYRLPVAVQPLKAFGAVAIAAGLGADVIAAGALLMGLIFTLLGTRDLLDRIARIFPSPVIRGVQLAVGLLFLKIAWGLVMNPQPTFADQGSQSTLVILTVVLVAVLAIFRHFVVLAVVVVALATALVLSGTFAFGPAAIEFPSLTWQSLGTAAVLLVLPQLPLTLANSCLAPADAAVTYFGEAGKVVTPSRLARTLGVANLFAGGISGMPVCHGAGGMSAHYAFGARTWRAPMLIGATLVVGAICFGQLLSEVLPAFPLSVLAALLVIAAVTHVLLLRDLVGWREWLVALAVGVAGTVGNLALAVIGGLVLAWVMRVRARRAADAAVKTPVSGP